MLPKEHGAYGQIAIPLVTSFVVAGFSAPAVLLAIAVVAAFVSHEPLLVLLGRRGVRAKRESRRRAVAWFAVNSTVAVIAGAAGAWSMPPDARWSLMVPLFPAAALGVAIVSGQEKGSPAAVAAALAFSLMAIPVCLAAGAPVDVGVAVAAVFAVVFVAGMLAVRRIVVAIRAGGNPRAARALRAVVLVVAGGAAVALAAAGSRALLPWPALAAAAPGLGAASWLALFPPPPTRLRAIGWTLVTTSAAAAVILIAGLADVQ